MVEYGVSAFNFEFGEDTAEEALNTFGLKIKRIESVAGRNDKIIYVVERKKRLTEEERTKLRTMGKGIVDIKEQ